MHMRTKFVMFPSGLALFPEVAGHNEFMVFTPTKEREKAVAAGYVYIDSSKQGIDSITFTGNSISLGLGVGRAYPDWRQKFTSSNLPVLCKYYEMYEKNAYFLPFRLVDSFSVRGIGRSTPEEGRTLNDVIESIK